MNPFAPVIAAIILDGNLEGRRIARKDSRSSIRKPKKRKPGGEPGYVPWFSVSLDDRPLEDSFHRRSDQRQLGYEAAADDRCGGNFLRSEPPAPDRHRRESVG